MPDPAGRVGLERHSAGGTKFPQPAGGERNSDRKRESQAASSRRGRSGQQDKSEMYVTSHVVPTEFIVQFHEYLSPDAQEGVLNEALGKGVLARLNKLTDP